MSAPPPPPPFDIESLQRIEPPWRAIKEWIPDDEPDLDWFNRPRKPNEPARDWFDQSRVRKDRLFDRFFVGYIHLVRVLLGRVVRGENIFNISVAG